MGLLNILNKMVAAKPEEPVHSKVPNGLHQGTAVKLPELDLTMARLDGSILPEMSSMQTISSVGIMTLFGKKVYNCYFSDGKGYLRLITENDRVLETTLFAFKDEIIPSSIEDWEFWLGKYQKDSAGEFVRDSSGVAIIAESGLIGWPNFQVDGNNPIIYNRAWFNSPTGVEPVECKQRIYSIDGTNISVEHNMMEYERLIGTEPNQITETLLVATSDVESSINISVGVRTSINELKIFPA